MILMHKSLKRSDDFELNLKSIDVVLEVLNILI